MLIWYINIYMVYIHIHIIHAYILLCKPCALEVLESKLEHTYIQHKHKILHYMYIKCIVLKYCLRNADLEIPMRAARKID